jgi:hypothetical protein
MRGAKHLSEVFPDNFCTSPSMGQVQPQWEDATLLRLSSGLPAAPSASYQKRLRISPFASAKNQQLAATLPAVPITTVK